jgi:hypothetical protein
MNRTYPDISDTLTRKDRARTELARLSFEEKLDMLDKLRTNEIEPGKAMREDMQQHTPSERR